MTGRLAIVALAACSGSHRPFPMESPDAMPDTLPSPTADAPPGSVTLSVTEHGLPAAGIAVYFQGADSSIVAAMTTDAHGTANAVLLDGSFVTVIAPGPNNSSRLSTFAAVRAGDALHFELEPGDPAGGAIVDVVVATTAGATGYDVHTPCGRNTLGSSGIGSLVLSCANTADFLVVALDVDGQPMSGLFAEAVPLAAPVMVTGSYASFDTTSFTYTDVPGSITFVRTYRALATPRGRVFDDSTSSPANGQTSNTLAMPPAPGTIAITLSDGQPSGALLDEQVVYDWGAPSPSYTLDFASAMLPGLATPPAYAVATRTITWTESGGATPSDLVRARIDVARASKAWSWSLVAPRAGATATFPQLLDYNPTDADAVTVEELANAHVPGGYNAFRAHGFANFVDAVAGSSGRIVVASYVLPGPL
jgi:hypothetical protein